jgi:hypothetical protein
MACCLLSARARVLDVLGEWLECRDRRVVVQAGSGDEAFLVRGWDGRGARVVWLALGRDRRCLVPERVRVRAVEVLDLLYECAARR